MGSEPVGMVGLAAGTPSGSLWGIGVLVADAAAGRGIPVVDELADRKVRRLVGEAEAEAGELRMVDIDHTTFHWIADSRKALMLCYSNRAATRMSLGKMREALSDCRKATGIDSSFVKAQVRAANCLLALGDVEEAQKAFEMCLKSNHLSSLDRKIVEEASDGLQKTQKISGFILQSKEYLIKKAFDKIPSALQMISDALSISMYSDNLMAMKAEALLLLQRYEERTLIRCGKQSQESISSFSMTISELLRLKAAGNEAFQSGKYLEAVEYYTTALMSNGESLRFLAVCFCNRAAAYQAMGQILDAIADCSVAIALDADYPKELIEDYDQAANDLRRLIALHEKQLQENMSMPLEKTESIRNNLSQANLRLSSLELDARKGASSNMYLILSENISDAAWREITNEIRRYADYLFKIIGNAYDSFQALQWHAARTSALSRRWAHRWLRALAASPVLDLTDRDLTRGQLPAQAAATVGRCLRLHGELGTPLHAFRVALAPPALAGDCGAFGRDAVGWVAAAVARGAREVEVEVDLASPPSQDDDEDVAAHADPQTAALLELPGDVFQARNSLEQLALGRFSLRAVPLPASGLDGLRALSLTHADVTDDAVRGVLAGCPALESLTLRSCHRLTSVSVASERLRVLELAGCRAVRELLVAAPALESLTFYGRVYLSEADDLLDDGPVALDVGATATPAPRDAYLSHLGCGFDIGPDSAYPNLYNAVAHARILTTCSVGLLLLHVAYINGETEHIDTPNLEELQLMMSSYYQEVDRMFSFFTVTSLPVLRRLFVRLTSPAVLHYGGPRSSAAATGGVVFDQLTLIKVVNFGGTGRHELRLLRFLLRRAPALEQLVLVTAEGEGAPGDEELEAMRGAGVGAAEGVAQGAHLRVPAQRRRQPQPCAHEVLRRGVTD
ncbi:hypothetical protein C2845_PM07G06340 [Panicum miliaceum]|uniref:F-box/LRR-repeat protein 15/At3g58940/PEG3-like LRR domain-containing protein n=1 Tax=Panicum miliaceum TaxID=4540 RepID=A0A3L6SL28_PANMI|nr:hypothetical protein C2845_PM07G06340 [Panicum miliaceum]